MQAYDDRNGLYRVKLEDGGKGWPVWIEGRSKEEAEGMAEWFNKVLRLAFAEDGIYKYAKHVVRLVEEKREAAQTGKGNPGVE